MKLAELNGKQITRVHQLLHEAKFRDPSGDRLSPAGKTLKQQFRKNDMYYVFLKDLPYRVSYNDTSVCSIPQASNLLFDIFSLLTAELLLQSFLK